MGLTPGKAANLRGMVPAYRSDGSIPILSPSQLDIAAKVINILSPIEEITKNISAEAASISQVIPLVRALTKVLEKVQVFVP